MESIIAGPRETLTDKGFYWRDKGHLKMLVCDALETAGFANGFSTRIGGVSPFPENDLNLAGYDDDTAANIEENRRRFLTLFHDNYVLATAWQEHGDGVKVVDSMNAALRSDEKYDAITSNLVGVLAGVKTADCVPVLLGDRNRGAYAAVHAGWRGSASQIVKKALEAMHLNFRTDPADVIAAIGPAACGRNYEIGEEVIRIFEDLLTQHQTI
jgi:polyphenol oxidase